MMRKDRASGDPGPTIPYADRSFGPAARSPRPRATLHEPRVARDLVVDPTDPAAFQEIDDAAAQAEDGDRIVVRPGIYRRPVVVDRAVRVESDGSTASIRLEPIGGEALGIAVSGATVAGLTIRPAEAGNDGGPWSAVAVHDATVTVEGCDLTSNAGATVWVGGPASRAVLLGCSLDGGSQNAVWVTEEGRAEVVACRVTGHRWPIAAIGEHAVLSIRDSEVSDNLDGGVGAADGATLIVEVSTIARNAGFGIQLESAAPASLVEDCTIEENATIGVGVDGGRGARIVRNRLRRNEVGITVTGGGAPTIEGNELPDNRLGIGVRGDDSDPVIVANTITGGASQGIVVDEQATGRFEGNRVSGCGEVGVWVDDAGTRPVFSGNHVSLCASVGIRVTHGAGGEFRTNDLRGNSGGSWGFHEPGALTRVANLEDAGTSSGEPAPRRLD